MLKHLGCFKDAVLSIWEFHCKDQVDGLVQDCSNSIANAMELLQSYTKPSPDDLTESLYIERWSLYCDMPLVVWTVSIVPYIKHVPSSL